MKVLLVRPDQSEYTHSSRSLGIIHQPLGLLYLASSLEHHGHEVSICDEMVGDNLNVSVDSFKPDLVGITVTSLLFDRVKQIVGRLKQQNIRVVLGGPHCSALPKQSFSESNADYVVVGEGEETLVDIANGTPVNDLHGVVFRNPDSQTIDYTPRRSVPEIETLPFPARHLLSREKYIGEHEIGFVTGKRNNLVRLFTSRGCPFQCTFCSSASIFGRKARFRSVDSVMEELTQARQLWSTDKVMFMDDTLTLKKAHIMGICQAILESNQNITWGCFSRAGIDKTALKQMKRAGCSLIGFGVESGSPRILAKLKKNITIEEVEESLAFCRELGIRSKAFIMIGVPGETEEDFQQTVDLCLRAKPDYLTVSIFTPLPGSELMSELSATHQVREQVKGNYYLSSDPKLKARQLTLLKKFHFRFDYLKGFVRNFSFQEVADYFHMFKAFLTLVRS